MSRADQDGDLPDMFGVWYIHNVWIGGKDIVDPGADYSPCAAYSPLKSSGSAKSRLMMICAQ